MNTVSFEDTEAWVRDHLTRGQAAGEHAIEDIAQVAPHPDGRVVACTVLVRERPLDPGHHRVAVVDLDGEGVTVLDLPHEDCTGPAWSPDGTRLALVGSTESGAVAVVLESPLLSLEVSATSDLPGFVESVSWSPDGALLALQVAMPGAEISDVYGSGRLGGGDAESWRPRVLPAAGSGRRIAHTWDPATNEARAVSELTVWELVWSGDRTLLAVTTEGPEEDAWYGAELTRLDLDGTGASTILVPDDQVSVPRAAPSGRHWSVLSGLQSDRGLPAGDLVVGAGEAFATVDTRGVHVTDHRWLDETTLLLAGLRGFETVVAHLDAESGAMTEVWSGDETCGEYFPEAAGLPGQDPLVVLESHRRPPTLGVLGPGGFRPVLRADGLGAAYHRECAGNVTRLTWESSDGLEIQGFLVLPEGEDEGPRPLVLQVHGGPTHAVRDTWIGRDPQTSCLVARGYAVLRPNPRGSTGRGAAFAEAVRGDMGGLDVDDVVSGVQHVVDLGIADPSRLGITGISYGGFLASWVPARTGLFAASVARSPCTDWLLQHLTSNIAEFDRRFLHGEPFDPASQYAERSPLRHVDDIGTPMLLIAGQNDLATPPSQAQVLHTALRERGVETQLVLYPEEGHGVRHPFTLADQCARMLAWFDLHLQAPERRPGKPS